MRFQFAPLLCLAFMPAAAGAQAQVPERVVSGDGIVAVTVNGAPGRLRIDPAAPALPILTNTFAQRAALRPGPFAFAYLVGPERVMGRSAVGRIAVGAGVPPRKRRIGWTERPYVPDADGVIGPGGLPEPVVRFVLRAPQPGERVITLPLEDEGGLFGGWGGSYALVDLGGEPLRVRFNPNEPRTLATAGAAVRIANLHEGRVSGETVPAHIAFGISRPVRTMRLGTPLTIGPFAISELGVRTADFGNASGIREEGGDPDEVVVTGDRRRTRNRDRLAIGADLLRNCSSITFDKRARQVRLSCT
ncbi:hypothetical protein [Allosphingosinicella sp.]|uniref:hypothetical protein n=1 Tax=Allosphingosinicella sp. TaxID=2823234 RepID=UPI003782F764